MKLKIRIAYGVCSYGVAILLLLTPYFSAPETLAIGRIVPFLCGALLFASAMLTDFEMGIARMLKFRDSVSLTLAGSLCVLLSLMFVSYGPLTWLITMVVLCQGIMSGLAFKTHYTNRHRLA